MTCCVAEASDENATASSAVTRFAVTAPQPARANMETSARQTRNRVDCACSILASDFESECCTQYRTVSCRIHREMGGRTPPPKGGHTRRSARAKRERGIHFSEESRGV